MQEILFSSSAIDLILSSLSLGLAMTYPLTLAQKVKITKLPKPLYQLVVILCVWNTVSIIGNLFFGGHESSILKTVLFGLQGAAWVQVGNATYHISEQNLKIRRSHFWQISNMLGGLSIIVLTVLFCTIPDKMAQTFGVTFCGLDQHPIFAAYAICFLLFVIPPLIATDFVLLKSSLQTSDPSLSQISNYMMATFLFFSIVPILFDFVLPLAYGFDLDGSDPKFLQWTQYCTLFLCILCGQYFTSVSFKNKSSLWFLTQMSERLGDSLIYFDNKGYITQGNKASLQLLQASESDIRQIQVQQLLPNINIFEEGIYDNVKVQIRNELHTFNVSIYNIRQSLTTSLNALLLSDQTNLLFYQQRIKTFNRQFAEYKQDLIRYQDRLDASEKKSKESENVNATLINALPFQFWSKNENGVYLTQNQKDINMRGNLNKTTDTPANITSQENKARNLGENSIFTTYEDADHNEISEEQAGLDQKNEKQVYIYQNHFIPIIVNRAPYKIIGLKIDMTEEKRLERERNLLREQKIIHSRLEDLGTACGAFAHDYNNILGSQIGNCELAQKMLGKMLEITQDSDLVTKITKANEFVERATKAAKNGKASLNVLLDSIRGKTNSKIDDSIFPPTEIVRDVINKLIFTLPPNIKIVSDQMEENIKIKAQAPSLERILSNLSNNAIYAMKENGGVLGFSVAKESLMQQIVSPYAPPIPTGEYVKISVSDTGSGMDSGTLERIFAPFFTTKAPGEGLGLGLSSALRLLKEGNAYFTVQTTVGKGTTFNLYWNLYKE